MKFKNKEELSKAYDELEKAYTKECQENKKLKEQLKLVEIDQNKIWQPKEGEHYWFVDANSMLVEIDMVVEMYVQNGNYFRTQVEAAKQAEYNRVMNRFRKYVETYSEPLDWENKFAFKYFMRFNHIDRQFDFERRMSSQDPFQIYASSKQILKDAIIYSAGSEEEFIRIVFGENDE